jgi:methionyl-tRNA formyltransferase
VADTQRLRIVFAGTPEFAVPALDAVAASTHQLVGVLTQPDRPAGRGRQLAASAVKQRALQLGLPIAQPLRLASEQQRAELVTWRPELLVVVAYGLILPQAVLDLPRLGCLNIHASLLPRWRGAAPIQRAILAGDTETGVAIMRLEAALDTGPIYAERRIPVGALDTADDLQQRLATLGAIAMMEVIDELAAGRAEVRAQSDAGVSYASKLSKHEALIDWSGSAAQISRQVRSFNPWPVAETTLRDQRLRIWRGHDAAGSAPAGAGNAPPGTVIGLVDGALQVACGQGVLAIETLQLPGRRVITAADFAHTQPLNGLRLGAVA